MTSYTANIRLSEYRGRADMSTELESDEMRARENQRKAGATNVDDARAFPADAGVGDDSLAPQVKDRFVSASVRARKPQAPSCCRPECCR